MKRQGIILNAREVRAGRRLLKRAAKDDFMRKEARALLSRGPAFAARFAQAAKMTAYYGTITDLNVAILIKAAAGDAAQKAAEHESDGWLTMAAAIRYLGS